MGLKVKLFVVAALMLAFARLARAQDVRRVVRIDVLGKAVEELGELPGGLVAERGQFEDQELAVVDEVHDGVGVAAKLVLVVIGEVTAKIAPLVGVVVVSRFGRAGRGSIQQLSFS